ncbi:MAG: lysine exporter LysO family protein [Clostridia bacterium]|nr:lysine exporter LysO family protein [Clostridia bacterium]
MWIILLMLVAGIAVGFFVRLISKHIRVIQRLQQVGVIALLFCMGVGIGGNRVLIKNIRTLGLRAVTFALLTAAFSIITVYVITRIFCKEKCEK